MDTKSGERTHKIYIHIIYIYIYIDIYIYIFTITYTHVISPLLVPFGEEFGLSLNKLLCVDDVDG